MFIPIFLCDESHAVFPRLFDHKKGPNDSVSLPTMAALSDICASFRTHGGQTKREMIDSLGKEYLSILKGVVQMLTETKPIRTEFYLIKKRTQRLGHEDSLV